MQTINQFKLKCLPVADERCVHSRELFLATIPPQEVCDSYEKLLDPQGLIRSADLKKRSNERVIGNLKTDSLKSSTLNWYYSKGSGNERKQIIFLKLVLPMEYSHPFYKRSWCNGSTWVYPRDSTLTDPGERM